MRARCEPIVALALVAAACDRHEPLVICHNANCAGPDVTRDDTPEAMRESLALRHDGLPVLDGMELDTFWYGAESRCLFAHDLVNDTTMPASVAADVIAEYLAGTARASWNGERFYVMIELKPQVGASYSDGHTAEQYVDHSECALDAVDRIVEGARAGGHAVTFGFVTADPKHLEVLAARPRWATWEAEPDVELLQIGDIFAPYSSVVPEIADYEHLDAVEYHPDFMTEPQRETYRSLGIELVQWSLVTTTEALGAIEHWEPKFAITNEASLVRRWAER